MKVQKNIEVWLVNKRNPRPIDLVQYDTGIQLVFAVQDFAIPSGTNATLYVQKPSGKFVYQETGINVSENTITIDLENQATTEHSNDVPYQVRLKNGGDLITTFTGIFRVEKSLADAGATESKTVVAAFEAKTAEQIAEIKAAAQEQIALIRAEFPELYAMKDNVTMLTNSTANAIKGNVSGAVVAVGDVSPVEHTVKCFASGKNLFDVSKVVADNQNQIINNGDGTLTVNTSSTSSAVPIASLKLKDLAPHLEVGNEYVLSADSTGTTKQIWLDVANKKWLFGESAVVTEEMLDSSVFMYASGNSTTAIVSNIQIEKGDTATEYTPYIDPSAVTVRRCGKNIFGVAAKSQTQNGVTFTVNDDGSVTANGTATKATFIGLGSLVLKPDEKYRLSGSPAGSGFDTYILYIHNNTTGGDTYDVGEGKVFTGKAGDLGMTIAVYAGVTVNNLLFRPMVVYGEENVAFEPYNGATYTPAADGTVSGLTSLAPNMTILTDTEGVTVECEYIRDTNKVIERLVNAITALGGTV